MKNKFWLIILVFLLPLTSCASVGIMRETYTDPEVLPQSILCPDTPEWLAAQNGISYIKHSVSTINVEWACIRVDLTTPGLTIAATPSKTMLGKRFYLQKTDFGKNKTPSVSLNTTPFDLDGRTYIPVSIVKIDGEEICKPTEQYAALCMNHLKNEDGFDFWKAEILSAQKSEKLEEYDWAFGGFYTILKDNQIFEFAKYKRSRTACGISKDGRFLYLFAVCGKNCPTGRNGLNFEECAVILRVLGCSDAMEFDGGHSTGLTLNGQNLIHPSLQRKVPAALAFFTE